MGKTDTWFKIPFGFGFGRKTEETSLPIKEGETIVVREWSWRKMRTVRKSYTKNGKIHIQYLD